MKSEHGAHGQLAATAQRRGLPTKTADGRTWDGLTMGHSHTPRPVRKHWWQFWRAKAQVYVVGTFVKPDAYAGRILENVMTQTPAWAPPKPFDEYARYGTHHQPRGASIATDMPSELPQSRTWPSTPLRDCKDCPWERGDMYERDCDYPHCSL